MICFDKLSYTSGKTTNEIKRNLIRNMITYGELTRTQINRQLK